MGLFSKKIDSYLGVDIGSHGMKLVELRKTKGRPQVWTYGVLDKSLDIHVPMAPGQPTGEQPAEEQGDAFSLDENRVEEYGRLLSALMKQSKVQTKRVTSSLPVSQVFHAVINLPHVGDKEVDALVKVEIAKMIPGSMDDMQLVYQMIPAPEGVKEKYTRVLVTAAPKRVVAFYTAIFQKAGLQLEELETEAFAVSRSLVGKDTAVSMIVDVGAERTNVFTIDNGLPLTHRSLKIGGKQFDEILAERLGIEDASTVLQLKKDLSYAEGDAVEDDLFIRLLDPIAKEVQYSLDMFARQMGIEGKRPEKIILTGGSAVFPPISRYLGRMFQIKVFVGDPWVRTIYPEGLKPILDEMGPRMAVAIGLALRNFS